MKKNILRIGLWVVGVALAILFVLFFLGLYGTKIQNYLIERRQEKFIVEMERQKEVILEKQKNDNYGGKTPEETLELYVEALKAGDIALASKYSEISIKKPNLQKEDFDSLKAVLDRDGNLEVIIKETENIIKFGQKKVWSVNQVSFVYTFITEKEIIDTSIISQESIKTIIPIGTQLDVGFSLRLNPYTNVWKIIQ